MNIRYILLLFSLFFIGTFVISIVGGWVLHMCTIKMIVSSRPNGLEVVSLLDLLSSAHAIPLMLINFAGAFLLTLAYCTKKRSSSLHYK